MILATTAYVKGVGTKLTAKQRDDLRASAAAVKRRGGFLWVAVEDADQKEMDDLADSLDLHPLSVEDVVLGMQQPKIQLYDEHLFVVLWSLSLPKPSAELTIEQTFLFVRDGLLVTAQRSVDKRRNDIAAILDGLPERVGISSLAALYGILAASAMEYTKITADIEAKLEKLEKQVFTEAIKENGSDIYRLRQQIGKAERAIAGVTAALAAGQDHLQAMSVGHEEVMPYLHDLQNDLVGSNTLIADQQGALEGVLSSHESNVASQQNVDTRKISAFAALLAVPALVAGLYGMNFKNLPGVNWSLGWEVVVAVAIIADVSIFLMFRKRKWM